MLESFQEKFNQIFHPPKSDDSFSFEEFDLQNPIMVCSKTFDNFYGMFSFLLRRKSVKNFDSLNLR